MGNFRHHAIIVTGPAEDRVRRAHRNPGKKFQELVSPVVHTRLNDFWSFFIAPDGSKELWDESDADDRCRAEYVGWLRQQVSDGHRPLLDWVEVMYGDELGQSSRVINDSTPPSTPEAGDDMPFLEWFGRWLTSQLPVWR